MGCCNSISKVVAIIEDTAKKYHPNDYKLFMVRRESGDTLEDIYQIGLVVLPNDEQNTQMYREFKKMRLDPHSCIKSVYSQVDLRDTRIVDLFVIQIEIEEVHA